MHQNSLRPNGRWKKVKIPILSKKGWGEEYMARKEIREIHCFVIKDDRLRIYLASSAEGAIGVGLLLDKGPDSIEYFRKSLP